jgi:HK97 family phage major capsid protein
MSKILELRQQRSRLSDEASRLIPTGGARMSAENRFKFDRIMTECDELKKQIDTLESDDVSARHRSLESELRQTTRPREAALDGFDEARSLQGEREHQRAFDDFLRNGLHPTARSRGVSAEHREILLDRDREVRDMGALGAGSAGAYLVPQGFVKQVDVALKFAGDMLRAGTIMQTDTGQPLPWPNENDTTISGEQVSENTQVTSQDVTLGSITFNAWKYSTKLTKVSIELMQDSAFDMTAFLAQTFGTRLGRILNNKFTVGVGTTEPNGIVTAAAAGPTATGASTNTGGSDSNTNTIGSIDLTELEHSVDRAYRRGASYMMSDTALKLIKEVLDKYGRPLWKPGLNAADPDTINGYPYYINNDMAVPAASAKSVLFGQLQKYMIREVKSLAVLRLEERFADYGQIGFIGFARYDGNLLDAGTHPVKYLIQHS